MHHMGHVYLLSQLSQCHITLTLELLTKWQCSIKKQWGGVHEEWAQEHLQLDCTHEEWERCMRRVEHGLGDVREGCVCRVEHGLGDIREGLKSMCGTELVNGTSQFAGLVMPPSLWSLSTDSTKP